MLALGAMLAAAIHQGGTRDAQQAAARASEAKTLGRGSRASSCINKSNCEHDDVSSSLPPIFAPHSR
jgi:hypothetical protein